MKSLPGKRQAIAATIVTAAQQDFRNRAEITCPNDRNRHNEATTFFAITFTACSYFTASIFSIFLVMKMRCNQHGFCRTVYIKQIDQLFSFLCCALDHIYFSS